MKDRRNNLMIKNRNLKKILIFSFMIIAILEFNEITSIKANAESNGWINVNNSWRYYSGPIIKTGWEKYNGEWYYLDENGVIKTGWLKNEGKWYFLDYVSGKMITGWIEDKENWYYLNSSGEMKTGWIEENGNIYYLNKFGVMVKDIYVGSYYLGKNGEGQKDYK
jgi:glucan-binding YG repeat protein